MPLHLFACHVLYDAMRCMVVQVSEMVHGNIAHSKYCGTLRSRFLPSLRHAINPHRSAPSPPFQ